MSTFWSGKRVLVAGGAGFIGSHMVEELVEDGARVTVADNFDSGNRQNLAAVQEQIEIKEADLRSAACCDEAARDHDVVMNLAAKAPGIGYSSGHHGELFSANSLIHLNLLEAARKAGAKRFLLVSSSCVYPDDAVSPTPELPAFTGDPEFANQGYGWAKRMAELQAKYYAAEFGMEIAIARPFNAYGGRCRWNEATSHVIPSLVRKVLRGDDPVVIWGSGEQRRNFLHACDFAWGMKLLTERYAVADPVNIGFEDTVSIRELIGVILRESGRGNARVEFDTSKPEGRAVKSADGTKLRQILPEFRSRTTIQDGIREVVESYRRNHPA